MTKELKNRILENKVLTHDERMEIIKALEQSSEDCVSRADLLKLYEDRFIELQKAHHTDKQLGVNWCINTLKEMPPVTPTHKVGYWDKTGGSFRCSECMHMPEFRDIRTLKYCPNCGKPMKWESNNE